MNSSSLPVLSDEGELSWSDNNSMSSDEGVDGDMLLPRSPPPEEEAAWMSTTSTSRIPTGQLSPISTGMDIPTVDASSAPTMVHSASSSCTDSWSIGYVEALDGEEADNDIIWEQGSDDVLTVPKLEPSDDDFILNDLKDAPLTPAQAALVSLNTEPKQKRPRGRPRKHPLTPIVNPSKITKGRSKTGCITCRRRKKKCDEAKPRCMNCEKNAVVCEGYHEKKLWRSGKEKAVEDPSGFGGSLSITRQPLFRGVEQLEDKIFWRHYCMQLSNVLTVEGEAKNAFKDIVLPLGNLHQGVMHSILAMSSKHIDFGTPYGEKLLEANPTSSREALLQRSEYHYDRAMEFFLADIQRSEDEDVDHKTIGSARYAQILCLLISTLIEGNQRGEHRVHLRGYQRLIQQTPPEDPTFLMFITEFFQYHIYADDLIWHPSMENPSRGATRLATDDWTPIIPIDHPRLLGVADGLFKHLSEITTIKNTIRANIFAGIDPAAPYPILYRAVEIDQAIENWKPRWPPGDSRQPVGLIYKHMMWVHLVRTITPPPASTQHSFANSLVGSAGPSSTAASRRHSQYSRPPTASSGASSPRFAQSNASVSSIASLNNGQPGSRNTSRTSSMHESDAGHPLSPTQNPPRPTSPPPFRRPAFSDHRITVVVEESLDIMESFKPSDPAMTILLMPCLVLGVVCFDPSQQARIRVAIKAVRGYTGLRNCDRVSDLLEEVWRLMEQGDWLAVWDWQGVAQRMGLDLCT